MPYDVATPEEVTQVLKGRLRSLELEHAGQVLLLAEANADPHAPDDAPEHIQKAISSLEARMAAVKAAVDGQQE